MKTRSNPSPVPPHAPNVVPLESWLHPLRCPRCNGQSIAQVDQLEFAYPVTGMRSRDVVQVDLAESATVVSPTTEPFFRCGRCRWEWPVEAGTELVDGRV